MFVENGKRPDVRTEPVYPTFSTVTLLTVTICVVQRVDGGAPVVEHLGGRKLKGHFVRVDAGKVDVQLVGLLIDEAVPGVNIAVVKAAAGQRDAVAPGEKASIPRSSSRRRFPALHAVGKMGVDEVGLCQIHRVGGHFGRRLLLDAVDGLDAADQDAIQPVIVQAAAVPRQLVLVDEGIERVSGKLVQLTRQRDRSQVAVHVRHVEAIGGPAVVGGKVDQIQNSSCSKSNVAKARWLYLPLAATCSHTGSVSRVLFS